MELGAHPTVVHALHNNHIMLMYLSIGQKLAIWLALMKVDIYTDILTWEVIHPPCLLQTKYVKCILPSE